MRHLHAHPITWRRWLGAVALLSMAGCSQPTDASPGVTFRAELAGSRNTRLAGTVITRSGNADGLVIDRGEGARMTALSMLDASRKENIAITVQSASVSVGTYSIAALGAAHTGTAPGAQAEYSRTTDDGYQYVSPADAGWVRVDSIVGGRIHGEFAFSSPGYKVYPARDRVPENVPVTPVGSGAEPITATGSFVAALQPLQ